MPLPDAVRVPKLAGVTDTLSTMRAENIPKGIPIGRRTPRSRKNKGTPRDNKDAPPPLQSAKEIKAEDKKIRRRRPIAEEAFKQAEYVGRRYDLAPESLSARKQDCRELLFENYYNDIYGKRAVANYQKNLDIQMQMQQTQQQLFQALLN